MRSAVHRTAVATITLAVVVTGCFVPTSDLTVMDGGSHGGGGMPSDGGEGTPSAITFDQYCQGFLQHTCESAKRCGSFQSVSGCLSVLGRSQVAQHCAHHAPGIRDGRTTYDGTAAAMCLASMDSCQTDLSCDRVFTGATPLDGGCFDPMDCVAGAWCNSAPGASTCPGHCALLGGVGAFVPHPFACRDDLIGHQGYNDAGTFGAFCDERLGVGRSCADPLSQSCKPGLFCNEVTTTCETARSPGSTCALADGGAMSFANPCQENHFCQPGISNPTPKCDQMRGQNQPCGLCRYDLRCARAEDGGRVCQAFGTLDQECASALECVLGLFCDPTSNACVAPRSAGGRCAGIGSCVPGLRCALDQVSDGGFAYEHTCVADDGGTDFTVCTDPTP